MLKYIVIHLHVPGPVSHIIIISTHYDSTFLAMNTGMVLNTWIVALGV